MFFFITELLAKKNTPSAAIIGNRVFIVFIIFSQQNDLFKLHDFFLFNKLKRIDSIFVSICLIPLHHLRSTCSVSKTIVIYDLKYLVTFTIIYFNEFIFFDELMAFLLMELSYKFLERFKRTGKGRNDKGIH